MPRSQPTQPARPEICSDPNCVTCSRRFTTWIRHVTWPDGDLVDESALNVEFTVGDTGAFIRNLGRPHNNTPEESSDTLERQEYISAEMPSACSCGATPEFFLDDIAVCGDCYIQEGRRRFGCGQCGRVPVSNYYLLEDRIWCRNCARQRWDFCRNCGETGELNSMRRQDGEPVCRRCYCPSWEPSAISFDHNTYCQIPRGITFGVEVETSISDNFADLEGETSWGCVLESSTNGREFVSPVLEGDKGLMEVREFLSKWAGSWQVDQYCGTHVHIGLRNFTPEQQRNIAYAYYHAWPYMKSMFPERALNDMCGSPQYDLIHLMNHEDFDDFAADCDRFEFVNWRALIKHGTVEIRFLPGTLDPEIICAWLKWNALFVQRAANSTIRQVESRWNDPGKEFLNVGPELLETVWKRFWRVENETVAQAS